MAEFNVMTLGQPSQGLRVPTANVAGQRMFSQPMSLPVGAGNPFTVSNYADHAQFTSIQAAVDAAVVAGANYTNPTVIDILGGRYNESIVIPGGGIILRGTNFSINTFLQGTIEFQLNPGASNMCGVMGLRNNGEVLVSGTSGGNLRWWSQFCLFLAGVTFDTADNAIFQDVGSTFNRSGGDAVSNPGMLFFDAFGSTFSGDLNTDTALNVRSTGAANQGRLRECEIFGKVTFEGEFGVMRGGHIKAGGAGPAVNMDCGTESEIWGVSMELSAGTDLANNANALGQLSYAGISFTGGTGNVTNTGGGGLVPGATVP